MLVFVRGYKGKGAGGWAIKWFTFGAYTHVSLVFLHHNNSAEEIESIQGKGVHAFPFEPDESADLFRVNCSCDQAIIIYETARRLLGSKYDWAGIWSFMRRRKRENPNKWFCSEMVAHCLKACDIELMRLPPWKQNPVMVCASTVIKPVGGIKDV